MLAIRMQRVGRKGHAQFRMVVQDRRFHPSSGRVVEYLGSYDPHSKKSQLDKEKLAAYLSNGAQPSMRVVKLMKAEKIDVPGWVKQAQAKNKAVKNPDKRRSTRPEEEKPAETAAPEAAAEPAEAPAEQPATEAESPAEEAAESPAEEQPVVPEAEKPKSPPEPSAEKKS